MVGFSPRRDGRYHSEGNGFGMDLGKDFKFVEGVRDVLDISFTI